MNEEDDENENPELDDLREFKFNLEQNFKPLIDEFGNVVMYVRKYTPFRFNSDWKLKIASTIAELSGKKVYATWNINEVAKIFEEEELHDGDLIVLDELPQHSGEGVIKKDFLDDLIRACKRSNMSLNGNINIW
jgi:hypothetical protein